jgi:hypothetical protein
VERELAQLREQYRVLKVKEELDGEKKLHDDKITKIIA